MDEQTEIIISRLKSAIEASNLSYVELEKKTNIAKSSIQRYANGKTKKIPIDAITLIAEATGTSSAWIMGWDNSRPTLHDDTNFFNKTILSEDKNEIISAFNKLSEDQKKQVKTFIDFLSEERK